MWVRGASWQRWPQKRRWWTCSTSSKTRQWRQHITWNWNRLFGLGPVTASTSLFVVVDYSAICSGDPCLVGGPSYERRKLQVELRGIFNISCLSSNCQASGLYSTWTWLARTFLMVSEWVPWEAETHRPDPRYTWVRWKINFEFLTIF